MHTDIHWNELFKVCIYRDIELSEVLAENIAIYSSGIHSRLFWGNEITYMTFDL